jgi:hypothetical protein
MSLPRIVEAALDLVIGGFYPGISRTVPNQGCISGP